MVQREEMTTGRTRPKKEMTRSRRFWRVVLRGVVHLFVWGAIAVSYYVVFSVTFDTGPELRLRRSAYRAEREYELLNEQYDSLVMALQNVAERDRNVFRVLFESDPYDFGGIGQDKAWRSYERLTGMDNRALAAEFLSRLETYEADVRNLDGIYDRVQERIGEMGDKVNNIPSIQPIVNRELTLLTASYGLLFHPFFGILKPHNGVDYTVPEGTHVFATADGVVRDVVTRSTGAGSGWLLITGMATRLLTAISAPAPCECGEATGYVATTSLHEPATPAFRSLRTSTTRCCTTA